MQSVSMSANSVRAVGNSFVLAKILAQPASLAGSAEQKNVTLARLTLAAT
jgi:hypothetical protein